MKLAGYMHIVTHIAKEVMLLWRSQIRAERSCCEKLKSFLLLKERLEKVLLQFRRGTVLVQTRVLEKYQKFYLFSNRI